MEKMTVVSEATLLYAGEPKKNVNNKVIPLQLKFSPKKAPDIA